MKSIDNLCGWELNNPDAEYFESQILEEFGGMDKGRESPEGCHGDCASCVFMNECLSSIQLRCLTPKNGKLVELGVDELRERGNVKYFALISEDRLSFMRFVQPSGYWASLSYVDREDVPDWMLSELKIESFSQLE